MKKLHEDLENKLLGKSLFYKTNFRYTFKRNNENKRK